MAWPWLLVNADRILRSPWSPRPSWLFSDSRRDRAWAARAGWSDCCRVHWARVRMGAGVVRAAAGIDPRTRERASGVTGRKCGRCMGAPWSKSGGGSVGVELADGDGEGHGFRLVHHFHGGRDREGADVLGDVLGLHDRERQGGAGA